MEGTVGDAKERTRLSIVSIFAITLKQSKSCDEVSLFQEMHSIGQLLLLLYSYRVGLEKVNGDTYMLGGLYFGSHRFIALNR